MAGRNRPSWLKDIAGVLLVGPGLGVFLVSLLLINPFGILISFGMLYLGGRWLGWWND